MSTETAESVILTTLPCPHCRVPQALSVDNLGFDLQCYSCGATYGAPVLPNGTASATPWASLAKQRPVSAVRNPDAQAEAHSKTARSETKHVETSRVSIACTAVSMVLSAGYLLFGLSALSRGEDSGGLYLKHHLSGIGLIGAGIIFAILAASILISAQLKVLIEQGRRR